MKIELGVVQSCSPEGCGVEMLAGGQTVQAVYSALVVDKIRIRAGQLVAVDTDVQPAQILWRWYRVRVDKVSGGRALITDRERQLEAALPPELGLEVWAGQEAWACGMEGGWEVHGIQSLAEPGRMMAYIEPHILAAYKV